MFGTGFPDDWSALKRLIWLRLMAEKKEQGTITTVTGISPLLLANALAHRINSLTQYGKCIQKETDLPSAYKRVLGFACDNNAMWEITGFKLRGSDTVRISFSINGACNVFGCYQGADAADNYDLYVSTTSGSKYFRYGNGTYLSYWSSSNLGQRFDVVYTPTGSLGMPQDSTWSELTFESANNLLIGSTTLTGSSSKLKGNLYGDFIVDGRLHLIPCERVSDGVLGYYDTYSETFYEPYTGFDGAVSLGYATVPSPDTPQGIVCNNGTIKYGWHDLVTTSQLSGYGTYVSPSSSAGNRAYKWLKDLPNGTYQFAVDGDYEIIVQWRDPADTSVIIPSAYENLSGWITSGVVTLDKSTGGYGIAVRRTSGTSSITPSNFDGVIHVAEKGIYMDGTPEVLTVVPIGSATQASTPTPETPVPVIGTLCGNTVLYALGDVKDTYDPATNTITRRVGSYTFNGTENLGTSSAYGTSILYNRSNQGWGANREITPMCNYFLGESKATGQKPSDTCFFNGSGHFYFRTTMSLEDFKAWLAQKSAEGNPITVYFGLETPTTEAYTGTPVGAVVNDVPALLRIYDPTYGDKMDELDIISGLVTRNVGYHVFTGEETLYASDSFGGTVRMNGAQNSWGSTLGTPVCTHFLGVYARSSGTVNVGECLFNSYGHFYFRVADNNIDTFKSWLAAQYAAGTPVIVFYQLATATTEQTTAHSLNTSAGDNVVSVASEVDPVTLAVEYMKGA